MSKYVKQATPGTTSIATTGNTDEYLIAAKTGKLAGAVFSSLAALAAHDSNYVTFSITNLGQGGAGTAVMLAATDANTTKATGGTALTANAKRTLTLSSTTADLAVTEGDRLMVRFAATGTLAGAVTRPIVEVTIKTAQR
jgi:carbon monoxide dehydrogenase subunit G